MRLDGLMGARRTLRRWLLLAPVEN
jgi:hypothetical protein